MLNTISQSFQSLQTLCLDVQLVDLGSLAGIVHLPLRTILLNLTVDNPLRPSLVRDLLLAAGVAQPLPDTPTCICEQPLAMPDEEYAVVS